jgi:hypothetical protein
LSKFSKVFESRRLPVTGSQEEKRGRGRPRGHAGGKRDDASYTQASSYIPRELHKKVKAALVEEEKEYSELIEELLTEWLKARQ